MHAAKLFNLNPTYHIKAEEISNPEEAVLLMTAGDFFFSFAILKHVSKEIVEFGYYSFLNRQEGKWIDFFDNNELLTANYFQSAIAFNPATSMLVPAAHYNEEKVQVQLDVLSGPDFHSDTITEYLPEWNLYTIARVPQPLHSAVNSYFVSGKSFSTNFVLLKNIPPEKPDFFLVDFRTDEFTVLVFKDRQLLLLNAYPYSTPGDVLYYLLKICRQYGIVQQEINIILAGLIEKNSAIFRELYKYFIHLQFDDLIAGITVKDELNKCPCHYFSTISKLAACVL